MGRRNRRGTAGPSGWLIIDKPEGPTSHDVVRHLRRCLGTPRVGHAGTLDPLATGVLPVAVGEATKTVAHIVNGEKTYRFMVAWGTARDTDDAEGRIVAESAGRPGAGGDPGGPARVHRRDRAGAAQLFGHQDRRKTGLCPRPGRERAGNAPADRDRPRFPPGGDRGAGSGGFHRADRQGGLYSQPGARPRPPSRDGRSRGPGSAASATGRFPWIRR